jgi:DNA-binding transcriptional LysR family regulator
MEKSDWHIFLAVVRNGSTLAASRHLKVSQSTVSRRIEVLETALGLKLFERRPSGYALTDSGVALVPRAEAIERAVEDALTFARQQKRGLSGQIRFTTLAAFGQTFMVPAIRDFRLAYPGIQVELVPSEAVLDLAAGEADVALRAGARPADPDLVARRVLDDGWSIYCSRAYAEKSGIPGSGAELATHAVIGLPRAFRDAPIAHWMDETVPESSIVVR